MSDRYKSIALTMAILVISMGAFLLSLYRAPRNIFTVSEKAGRESEYLEKGGEKPADWFYLMRAYPLDTIPYLAVERARKQAQELKNEAKIKGEPWVWTPGGPYNIGGRITAIASDTSDPQLIYLGAADGGVFKSTDGGNHWTPIFDYMPSLSIGALTIEPGNPQVLYVGTGEANSSGDSYDGDGLYVTRDGGNTWEHLGLSETKHIGRIIIRPDDHDVIFVAAMGNLFSTNPERGVYRSTDGGETWEKVLFISDSTGCIDIAINPSHPDTVFAAMWERIRRPSERRVGGYTSGIWRSTDGGDTWERLEGGLPGPGPDIGRIGLAISQSNPSVVYAIYCDHPGYFMGLFKSTDGGDTWSETNDEDLEDVFYSYGWYFGNIRVDPQDPDVVYVLGIPLMKSTDGGNSWMEVTSWDTHVDQHDLWIDPSNPNHLLLGNDGGFFYSNNGGSTWVKSYDLPVTQFYRVTVDHQNPERIYGGTQDNGTVRTLTGDPYDWEEIYGGDGFFVIVDPTNPNIIYAEYQYGGLGKSADGGYTWNSATDGIDEEDRTNWDTPVVMDPSEHLTLYYGTYRLYRTTNGAEYWDPISEDLTGGPHGGNLYFGTITSICVAPSDRARIYVGTDDGYLWTTPDTGTTWYDISGKLPERWVTDIEVDPVDPLHLFVSYSGYAWDEYLPHVFESYDGGNNWVDISYNLPEAPVNTLIFDTLSGFLFVGTDFGVYYLEDTLWHSLGENLPNAAVTEMVIDQDSGIIVAGTHGRSTFVFNLKQMGIGEKRSIVSSKPRLEVFPNPALDEVLIKFSFQGAEKGVFPLLRVYDASGRIIFLKKFTHKTDLFIWDLRDKKGVRVPSGTYFVSIKIGKVNRVLPLVITR